MERIFEALEDEGNAYQLSEWLKFNSKKRIAGLIEEANNVRDEENYVQNPNQHVLRGLARLDWDLPYQ